MRLETIARGRRRGGEEERVNFLTTSASKHKGRTTPRIGVRALAAAESRFTFIHFAAGTAAAGSPAPMEHQFARQPLIPVKAQLRSTDAHGLYFE